MQRFTRYIGIDYSGAQTPDSSLNGLRVYMADEAKSAEEVLPPPSPRKYWTRRGVADWLVQILSQNQAMLVGIDHGFSFPLKYFKKHHLDQDWSRFLNDFCKHWPTDEQYIYVDSVREGLVGNGASRVGSSRWKRFTEIRAGSAKSVFHFDVPGSVAKSTHAGLPWLRYIRQHSGNHTHFWPFDGWDIPAGKSVIAEVYPALWNRGFSRNESRTADQHDAWSIAEWMRRTDLEGKLPEYFKPGLTPDERTSASIEGWILGVM